MHLFVPYLVRPAKLCHRKILRDWVKAQGEGACPHGDVGSVVLSVIIAFVELCLCVCGGFSRHTNTLLDQFICAVQYSLSCLDVANTLQQISQSYTPLGQYKFLLLYPCLCNQHKRDVQYLCTVPNFTSTKILCPASPGGVAVISSIQRFSF